MLKHWNSQEWYRKNTYIVLLAMAIIELHNINGNFIKQELVELHQIDKDWNESYQTRGKIDLLRAQTFMGMLFGRYYSRNPNGLIKTLY